MATADLDGDGRHEILLQERTVYSNCDLSTGGRRPLRPRASDELRVQNGSRIRG